jgi:hypothetical protein
VSSHYSKYQGQSIGKLIHFLHYYCNYHISNHAQIGDDKVVYEDKLFATITWEVRAYNVSGRQVLVDVPVFDFQFHDVGDVYKSNVEEVKRHFMNQLNSQEEAIQDLDVFLAGETLPNLQGSHIHY